MAYVPRGYDHRNPPKPSKTRRNASHSAWRHERPESFLGRFWGFSKRCVKWTKETYLDAESKEAAWWEVLLWWTFWALMAWSVGR